MLLPFQGVIVFVFVVTQGVTLGYALIALSGRTVAVSGLKAQKTLAQGNTLGQCGVL